MIPAEQLEAAVARLAVAAQQCRRVDLELAFGPVGDVRRLNRAFDPPVATEQQTAGLARVLPGCVVANLFGSRAENREAHTYID